MDLKTRKVHRLGGSLAVVLDPDFAREAGIEEGCEVYSIADKKFMVVTRDKVEAESINAELHAHARKFLRARISETEKQEAANE